MTSVKPANDRHMDPARGERLLTVRRISPFSRGAGQPFSYGALVFNQGEASSFQVRLEHQLPAGARFVSSQPHAEVDGNRLAWNLGQLDPGQEQRVEVQVEPANPVQTLVLVGPRFRANYQRPRTTQPRLVLVVTGPEAMSVGERAAFQLQITNAGGRPATQLVIRHHLSGGLEHPRGRQFEITHPILPPNKTLQITVRATATKPGGQFYQAVVTTSDGFSGTAEAPVPVTSPALELQLGRPS